MSASARDRENVVGRRFLDDGVEYVVMSFCDKYWKRSLHEVAFYSKPGNMKHPKKWEWSLATEVEAMVKKHPVIDKNFCATLLLRAMDLDTHPLATLTVAFCVFWSMYEDGDVHKANAEASEAFFVTQRADPYLNGALDGMMYSALYALAEVGRALQNALLLKPVRQGIVRDTMPFFSYVNTTGEVIVNTQSFEIIKALMWLAGFKEINFARGVTKWVPIATGDMALPIIKRLIGIESLKTGINPLVKIETFERKNNPMFATDAELCVVPVMCLHHFAIDDTDFLSSQARQSTVSARGSRSGARWQVPPGLADAPHASRRHDRE